MSEIDKIALRLLVFEKTGIKIDESDPSFAVAVMAEVLLLDAAANIDGKLIQAKEDLAKMADRMTVERVALGEVVAKALTEINLNCQRASEHLNKTATAAVQQQITQVQQVVGEAAEKAAATALSGEVKNAIKPVTEAAKKLLSTAENVQNMIRGNWFVRSLGYLVAAIVGGFVVLGISGAWSMLKPADAPNKKTADAAAMGVAVMQVWQRLDPQTQKLILNQR